MKYCSLQSQSARRGFTLIELITVMALISILASFFVMDSSNARRLQRLDVAANTLVSTIREVQAWGQSGRGYSQDGTIDSEYYDRGFGVYVTDVSAGDANRKIVIYGGAGTGAVVAHDRYTPTTNWVSEITLPAGVTVGQICVVHNVSGVCQNRSEVHILSRRGSSVTRIHNYAGAGQWHNSQYTQIRLDAGTSNKTIEVNKFGLVYVQ